MSEVPLYGLVLQGLCGRVCMVAMVGSRETGFFLDYPLVRIHLIIVMIRWTGLAPWDV